MDKGALRSTGKATTKKTSKGWQAKVSFGGTADDGTEVDYAVIVHNDLEPKQWTTDGTGPLYLSKAVQETWGQVKELFINSTKNSLIKRIRGR
jgi:hypothetical protein